MLYSILSQINKGLRRIDILRKSEIGISRRSLDESHTNRRQNLLQSDINPDQILLGFGNPEFPPQIVNDKNRVFFNEPGIKLIHLC